MKKLQWSLNAP